MKRQVNHARSPIRFHRVTLKQKDILDDRLDRQRIRHEDNWPTFRGLSKLLQDRWNHSRQIVSQEDAPVVGRPGQYPTIVASGDLGDVLNTNQIEDRLPPKKPADDVIIKTLVR
jgi:hypothetical protein